MVVAVVVVVRVLVVVVVVIPVKKLRKIYVFLLQIVSNNSAELTGKRREESCRPQERARQKKGEKELLRVKGEGEAGT